MTGPMPVAPAPNVEQQRAVVEQILGSTTFRKSHKLASFLRFICEEFQQGRVDTIHEQRIGVEVFGRPEGYHIGEDSIVRSQARFLRLRLQEYYATEGKKDAIVLTIPKGSYVPEFHFREETSPVADLPAATLAPVSEPVPEGSRPLAEGGDSITLARRRWIFGGVALLLVVVVGLSAWAWRLHRADRRAAEDDALVARFWGSVFDPQRTTIVVPADSSLVLMNELTGVEITLPDYMTKRYRTLTPPPGTERMWSVLLTSQYTNVADLKIVSSLQRTARTDPAKTQIRFARDLSMSELKQNNVVLLGSARANPWVDLFEPAGRFRVWYDPHLKTNVVENRNPGGDEKPLYAEQGDDTEHLTYGVAAYVTSLDGQGSCLLIGGTSKAGTETAADFLLSPEFAPFLRKLSAGGPIPHFEVLLAAHSLNGTSYQRTVLATHVLPTPQPSR